MDNEGAAEVVGDDDGETLGNCVIVGISEGRLEGNLDGLPLGKEDGVDEGSWLGAMLAQYLFPFAA